MFQIAYIYVIKCPKNQNIRYVGQTSQIPDRFSNHISAALCCKDDNHPLANWIKSLLSEGLKPVFEVVNCCSKNQATAMEQRYYLKYMGSGLLLNKKPLYNEWEEIDRELLKHIAKKKKVTFEDIATACDLPVGTIRNIFLGKYYGITLKKARAVQSYVHSLAFPKSGPFSTMYPQFIR